MSSFLDCVKQGLRSISGGEEAPGNGICCFATGGTCTVADLEVKDDFLMQCCSCGKEYQRRGWKWPWRWEMNAQEKKMWLQLSSLWLVFLALIAIMLGLAISCYGKNWLGILGIVGTIFLLAILCLLTSMFKADREEWAKKSRIINSIWAPIESAFVYTTISTQL